MRISNYNSTTNILLRNNFTQYPSPYVLPAGADRHAVDLLVRRMTWTTVVYINEYLTRILSYNCHTHRVFQCTRHYLHQLLQGKMYREAMAATPIRYVHGHGSIYEIARRKYEMVAWHYLPIWQRATECYLIDHLPGVRHSRNPAFRIVSWTKHTVETVPVCLDLE